MRRVRARGRVRVRAEGKGEDRESGFSGIENAAGEQVDE